MNKYTISHEEMRFIRREWINHYLHLNYALNLFPVLSEVMTYVRDAEKANYGSELQAYKDFQP